MRPLIVLVVAAFFYLGAQLATRLHRGAEISPLEPAASAALLVSRAGGYAFFPGAPDFRINGLGANYELLLADVLAVQRADTIAEWTSILFFVLLLLAATALARRWWGEGRYLFAVPYLVAA